MQYSLLIGLLAATSSVLASPVAVDDSQERQLSGPMETTDLSQSVSATEANDGPVMDKRLDVEEALADIDVDAEDFDEAAYLHAALGPLKRSVQGPTTNDTKWVLPLINKYDRKYGIPVKKWSTQLHNNAYKTVQAGKGYQQIHHLYPGTYAQVLCPGRYTNNPSTGPFGPFELAYLGWLCEKPRDPQLGGVCAKAAKYSHIDSTSSGNTGHHDILTNKVYKTIGCAFYATVKPVKGSDPFQGIWGCDLGF